MPERFWRMRGKVHVDLSSEKRGRTTISLDSGSNVEVVLCQEDAKASCRMRDEGGPFGAAV